MILADTNVWIKHFRESDDKLITHLNIGSIACHPFIIGELACGNLGNRSEILTLLKELPALPVAETVEILDFIEYKALMGRGLGYIDVHLLASAIIGSAALWTYDCRLHEVATEIGILYLKS